jgi:hypothetical protein
MTAVLERVDQRFEVDDDSLQGDNVISGFALPVAKLFEDLDDIVEPSDGPFSAQP